MGSPYGGGVPSQSNYHQQGHNGFGDPGGSHHQAGASSSYYGNHLGGYTHAAQGPASHPSTPTTFLAMVAGERFGLRQCIRLGQRLTKKKSHISRVPRHPLHTHT